MGKVILLEGPDYTGKTTLGRHFEELGYTYFHLLKEDDPDLFYQLFNKQIRKLKEKGEDIVIDRAHISNYIYSDIFSHKKVSESLMLEFKSLIDVIIICLPLSDRERYIKDFNANKAERKEMFNEMEKVFAAYAILYASREDSLLTKDKDVILYDFYQYQHFYKDFIFTFGLNPTVFNKEDIDKLNYTYGAELEVADWDREIEIPRRLGVIDKNDITIVNTDGIAANPYKKEGKGGEINMTPCNSIDLIVSNIEELFSILGKYSLNYSCWLHIHIGFPDKEFSLKELKYILRKVHKANKWIPFTCLSPAKVLDDESYVEITSGVEEMLIRRNLTRTSRMTEEEYEEALRAATLDEFWEPFKRKRHLINMYSLLIHKTIEFRFFYMSDNREKLLNCFLFCKRFMNHIFKNETLILENNLPEPFKIDSKQELNYLRTRQDKRDKVDNFTGEKL